MMDWQKTAWLFPGQGSQYVGMGRAIAEAYPAAEAIFTQADAILGVPLSQLCWYGPEADLNDTYNTQPALFVTSIAVLRALDVELEKRGQPPAQPALIAGHSAGEIIALVAAGAMEFADGLRLIRERGRLMKEADEHAPGGMAAVLGLEREFLAEICHQASAQVGRPVVVANDNCPGQLVISGDIEALTLAMEKAQSVGAKKVIRLPISIAAHSPLMARSSEAFRQVIESTPIVTPKVPLVGNATADILPDVASIHDELSAQLTSPVRWTESVQMMANQGITTFIEFGAKDVLVGLVKRIYREGIRYAVETPEQLIGLFSE